ncbi:MAG: T9SS type A sorting domain-containing protein [Bacteroidetes bacterium]|nr:T9SS type A sorting domain-containing protein [Bacteroidota bacterium]
MKKTILILFLYLISVLNSDAQWIQQNSGTNVNLYDIEFLNEKTGWAVGDAGVVIKTTNGGTNWINIPNPSNQYGGLMWSIQPIDSEYVYATAGYDFIMKSTNGGANWNVLSGVNGSISGYNELYFLNRDTGWFLGSGNYKILRTYDGGNTLDSFYVPWFTNFDIYFKDINTGIFCGTGRVFKSTNGGENWFDTQVTNPGSFPMFRKLAVVNNRDVWVSGLDAIIYRSTDFCDTWQAVDTLNEGIGIIALDFINKDTGYIGGGSNKIFKTIDGGFKWSVQTSIPNNSAFIGSIRFVNDSVGWYCGGIGNVYKTLNGGTPTSINITFNSEISIDYLLEQNYPNPFNHSSIIRYKISKSSLVEIDVYDLLGKKIKTLKKAFQIPGYYEIKFDNNEISSGILFYLLKIDGVIKDKKTMIVLK